MGEGQADVDLIVRAAEMADTDALASLMTELGYPTRGSEMQMRLEVIAKNPQYRTFVAVRNGEVCGMLGTFCYYGYEHNNPGAKILALVVAEGSRGGGVGRRLIAAAENDLAQRNIQRLVVDTRLEREGAHKFYESMGYVRNGFRFMKSLAAAAD